MMSVALDRPDIAWGPIGQEVYERTYSRPLPGGGQEEWPDTVRRVVDSNLALGGMFTEEGEREALMDLIGSFKILPAGRHLWAGGADTTLGLFNCHRAGWDATLASHFVFTFDQLMLGGGVGANYSQEYLDKAPAISNRVFFEARLSADHPDYEEARPHLSEESPVHVHYVVEDSREGWVNALDRLSRAFTIGHDFRLVMDFSNVRHRGEPIRGFGGVASGPAPLISMLSEVADILNRCPGRTLMPLEAMDVDHAIAACVISGNVRRSARMSILHWDDPQIMDFIRCKEDPSKHWTTNVSVEVDDNFFFAYWTKDPHAVAVMDLATEKMILNGEPGFFNSSAAADGEAGDVRSTNPCGEIALEEWEQCCLGHVNLAAFADDHEGAKEAFRLMTRFLLRATLSRSSSRRQEMIKAVNRRIGVGFFGFHDWAALLGVPYSAIADSPKLAHYLRTYKGIVDREAAAYAATIGVPAPVKTTTVAPTGSIAKLPGVSEGIQPPFARYFVRRVRYASNDPKVAALAAEGYHVEPCIYSANTSVVSFPCRDGILDRVPAELVQAADEVSVESYLRVQEMVQRIYADNAISITVNFRREDLSPEALRGLMQRFLPSLKGVTLMPEDGRPQSPYERISEDEYYASSRQTVGQAFDDCATGACPVR